MSRPLKLTLAFFAASGAVGLAATAYTLAQADQALRAPGAVVLLAGQLVALCTLANLLARFIRWQYLLRRLGVRLHTLPSLAAFAGSFAFLPVPFYIGQMVARTRLAAPGAPTRRGTLLLAFVWERALDVWALALLATPVFAQPWSAALGGACALALLPRVRTFVFDVACRTTAYATQFVMNDTFEIDRSVASRLVVHPVLTVSVAMSVAAWLLAGLSLIPLAWAAGIELSPVDGVAAATSATLAGGLSMVPLGAGVSGILLLRRLERLLAEPAAAALVVVVFRAATLWFTVAIGAVALALHRWRMQPSHHDHFDDIDHEYDAWLPSHFRNHLVVKKTSAMAGYLSHAGPTVSGLDIGCGRGWYLHEMQRRGFRMAGVDLSARQLAAARAYAGAGVPVVRGSVLGLPFRERFDFAYIINVLHHMPTPARQVEALEEIGRVVRPGGMVFVHEMNVINPVFRFYLSYVFPILKGIEEGAEPYMDPRELHDVPGLRLERVDFFSFIPDFTPAWVMDAGVALERRLEQGPLGRYSAHFMAVFRKTGAPGAAS
jgi:SAM-dependent methyltransferase